MLLSSVPPAAGSVAIDLVEYASADFSQLIDLAPAGLSLLGSTFAFAECKNIGFLSPQTFLRHGGIISFEE